MTTYKYAYATEQDWKEKAERKLYAQSLRKAISLRGRTTALKVIDGVFEENELSGISDDELKPENGYYILGHRPPFKGDLQKQQGYTTSVISFREDENGQEWAVMKCTWESKAYVPESVLTTEQATALNAKLIEIENNGNYWYVPTMPFDFTDVINSYNWDVIQDTPPTWKVIAP